MRQSIQWFSMEMEKILQSTDCRYPNGWRDDDVVGHLFCRLVEKVGGLSVALREGNNDTDIVRKAVDIANFAMMIADKSANNFNK